MVERRTITFSGRVQGVGFRMTVVEFAHYTALSGSVRNLPDGDVELIVEGPTGEIDALIHRLREHFGAFIRSIVQRTAPPLGTRSRGIQISH